MTIAFGIITPAPQASCPNGIGDFIWPAADVYVVSSGGGGGGGTLSDVTGSFNTVVATGGGGFPSLTIGFTGPAGSLGPGTYAVVYDECQDGQFDAAIDQRFDPAFEVVVPVEAPSIAPAISNIKSDASDREVHYADLLTRYSTGLAVLQFLESFGARQLRDVLLMVGMNLLGNTLDVVDPPLAAVRALVNMVLHYRGIRKDPPDSAYEQLTPVELEEEVTSTLADPLLGNALDLARTLETEAAIAQALLRSIERYQGAAGAGDGQWALRHARGVREHAALLAARQPFSSDGLAALQAELAADGRDLDGMAADLLTLRNQLATSGFSLEQEQLLGNAEVDDATRTAIVAAITALDSSV